MPSTALVGEPGSIAAAVAGLGIRATYVDGRDVMEVFDVAKALIANVRNGEPAFLECKVFRVKAHSLSDPDYRYREQDAGEQWLSANDPLRILRERLDAEHGTELDKIDNDVTAEIAAAVAWAESQEEPDRASVEDSSLC
jgi:TPP-dependent pyruvate/acetoin dehydrogenase alpha subunit